MWIRGKTSSYWILTSCLRLAVNSIEGVKGGVNSPFTKKGNALSPIIQITFPHSPKIYFPNNANHHSLKINFPIHHSPLIFFIFTFHQVCSFTISPTFKVHFHVSPTLKIHFHVSPKNPFTPSSLY